MKIDVNSPMAHAMLVTLNGEIVHNCIEADSDAGYAIKWADKRTYIPGYHVDMPKHKLFGEVKIFINISEIENAESEESQANCRDIGSSDNSEPVRCSFDIGCDEYGRCYAEANGQSEKCGRHKPTRRP